MKIENGNSATRQPTTFAAWSLLIPATTHVSSNYPRLVGTWVEKEHFYFEHYRVGIRAADPAWKILKIFIVKKERWQKRVIGSLLPTPRFPRSFFNIFTPNPELNNHDTLYNLHRWIRYIVDAAQNASEHPWRSVLRAEQAYWRRHRPSWMTSSKDSRRLSHSKHEFTLLSWR